MVLFWTIGLTRAMGDKTRLVETDAEEKNFIYTQEFSILLEKLKETKERTEFETISSSRALRMLEGLLDRMMSFLTEPARTYKKNESQTYHGLRLV